MAYLPDLIREGAKKTDKGKHAYYTPLSNEACAVGAAAIAVFGTDDKDKLNESSLGIKCVDLGDAEFPVDRGEKLAPITSLTIAIVELNDQYNFSREAIAEWLEEEVDDEKLHIDPDTEEEEEEEDRELQPA